MIAKTIYDTAPLGATITYSDGAPQPPVRFTKKLAVWKRSNGAGRLVRKTPPVMRGSLSAPAAITLHEGDITSGGTLLVVVHCTHDVDSALHFEIAGMPKEGSWRVVQPYGETVELLHLAETRAAAGAWLKSNRYSGARIESVDSASQELASAGPAATPLATSARETV